MPEARRGPAASDSRAESEPALGKTMAAAREQRGSSQSEVSREARIPAYYVRMIEGDDYSLIADQLYLLPFLRRYAAFLGLDPEEIASRFIREVQRADTNAARMSKPIPMTDKRAASWPRFVLGAVAGAALGAGAFFAYRHFRNAERVSGGAPAAAARPQPAAPASPPLAAPGAASSP